MNWSWHEYRTQSCMINGLMKLIFILVLLGPQVLFSRTCKDLFQKQPTRLQLKITNLTHELVETAQQPGGIDQIYKKNFINIQKQIRHELDKSSWIIRKKLFGKKENLRYQLMKSLLQKIELQLASNSFDSFDQLVFTHLALELIHNESGIFKINSESQSFVNELMGIKNPQQQMDFLINSRLINRSTLLGGANQQTLKKILSLPDGWRLVPVDFSLSAADLIYLNLSGLAPLWVSTKSYKVDTEKLTPAELFTHDLAHYLRQVMISKNDKYGIFPSKLKILSNIIRKLVEDDAEIIAISAAFYISHELMHGNSVLYLQNNPNLYSTRFSDPDDLGFLFAEYHRQTGLDLSSFMNTIADLTKQKLTEADLVDLD